MFETEIDPRVVAIHWTQQEQYAFEDDRNDFILTCVIKLQDAITVTGQVNGYDINQVNFYKKQAYENALNKVIQFS